MANLKLDLLNKLRNDKYYKEIELVRLAQDPNMNYEEKIYDMDRMLEVIALINIKLGLVEQYFQEPAQPQGVQMVQNAPAAQVHPGQTHGE
jgi:hypothetical protein